MAKKRIGDYWFKCPKFGYSRLEEILVESTVATLITDVGDFGDLMYGSCVHEDGEVDRYQCVGCGMDIVDANGNKVTEEEELLEIIYFNKTKFSEEAK